MFYVQSKEHSVLDDSTGISQRHLRLSAPNGAPDLPPKPSRSLRCVNGNSAELPISHMFVTLTPLFDTLNLSTCAIGTAFKNRPETAPSPPSSTATSTESLRDRAVCSQRGSHARSCHFLLQTLHPLNSSLLLSVLLCRFEIFHNNFF